jgi:putative FmdB family regulatory protein
MPSYDYKCDDCGHEWEVQQKITEDPLKECEKCKKNEAKRQIGKSSFLLKGGGWYSDGYSGTGTDK